jgi:hypothetical protein
MGGSVSSSATPAVAPAVRRVANNSTLGRTDDDGAGIRGGRSVSGGISGAVVLADELKRSVVALETRLVGQQQTVSEKQAAQTKAAAALTDASSKLTFGDKYFSWLGAGDKGRRDVKKDAQAAEATAASELTAARDAADKTDRAVREQIAATLRGQPSVCTYADLERSRQPLQTVLDAARRFGKDVGSAVSAVDSAIDAKQWDNMTDVMDAATRDRDRNGAAPSGMGAYSDFQVLSAKSDAQAAISRMRGSADALKSVLATYKPELAGLLGSTAGVDVGVGVFDFFMGDNPFFGMMDISNMSSARGQLQGLSGQVQGLIAMIGSQADGLDMAMDAQVSAVRTALRA